MNSNDQSLPPRTTPIDTFTTEQEKPAETIFSTPRWSTKINITEDKEN